MLDAATGEIIAWDTMRGRIGDTTANHAAYRRVRAHLETTCSEQWRVWKASAAGGSSDGGKRATGPNGVGVARSAAHGSGRRGRDVGVHEREGSAASACVVRGVGVPSKMEGQRATVVGACGQHGGQRWGRRRAGAGGARIGTSARPRTPRPLRRWPLRPGVALSCSARAPSLPADQMPDVSADGGVGDSPSTPSSAAESAPSRSTRTQREQ
eukprot:5238721-Prymnesium_polylepis.2